MTECPRCRGTGKAPPDIFTDANGVLRVRCPADCPACDGTGRQRAQR